MKGHDIPIRLSRPEHRESGPFGSGTIYQRTGKFRLDRYIAIDQGSTHHLEITVALLEYIHLNPQLVARDDGLTETAFVDSRKIYKLGIPALIPAEQQDDSYLRERFDKKHSGHNGVIREMALKKRFIDGDVLDPHHVSQTVTFENSVYQQEWVALRQDL